MASGRGRAQHRGTGHRKVAHGHQKGAAAVARAGSQRSSAATKKFVWSAECEACAVRAREWGKGRSWWLSRPVGVVLGSIGFLVRVLVLSLLVGENLWVVITRAGAGLLERLIALLQLPISPDLTSVQLMALGLVVVQEVIYVLSLHALAYWIFPRLNAPIPEPPKLLQGLVALDPL